MKYLIVLISLCCFSFGLTPTLAAPQKHLMKDKHLAFLDAKQIKYEIYKVSLNLEQTVNEFNFTYSVEFPDLQQNQFNILMAHFGGTGKVPWVANQRYNLIDFLPAKVQIFINKTLNQDYLGLDAPAAYKNPMRAPTEPIEFETGMACWDFAYELVREGWSPKDSSKISGRLFHIGAPIVDAVMKSPRYIDPSSSTKISALDMTQLTKGKSARNYNRQVGDILLIDTFANYGAGAAHAMVWLDDDFYIEKSDMGSEDPFRFVFYEDGIRFWLNEMTISPENLDAIKGTFYRYPKGLPDPHEFAGNWFFYDWEKGVEDPDLGKPKEPLSAEIAHNYIWNLDVNLGGGLSRYRINSIFDFEVEWSRDGRARIKTSNLSPHVKLIER